MDDEDDLSALLVQCLKARSEIEGTTAELAAGVYQLYRLTRLADQLEEACGPTLLARQELLVWLADQIERIRAAGIVDGNFAAGLINEAYLESLRTSRKCLLERRLSR